MTKTKTKLIRVTAANIRDGRPENTASCPVALALKRCKPARWVADYDQLARRDANFIRGKSIPTPPKVAEFMHRFDKGLPVKPFAFRIRL